MVSKAQKRRDALAQWWQRPPWPCVIASIDPGWLSGGALLLSMPGHLSLKRAEAIDLTAPRQMEDFLIRAFGLAEVEELPLVAVLEDWGAGGPRGIKQWIGLGEARGVWRRHLLLMAQDSPRILAKRRIVTVTQSRWRSRVIDATGVREPVVPEGGLQDGLEKKWRPFTPDEWKEAARDAAQDYFPDTHVPPLDAAEAAAMGIYAARSDEVLKVLAKRELDAWQGDIRAEHRQPLEPTIRG